MVDCLANGTPPATPETSPTDSLPTATEQNLWRSNRPHVTLQCCVTVSVHVGIHVMMLYDVAGFNNTRREVRCMMGDRR